PCSGYVRMFVVAHAALVVGDIGRRELLERQGSSADREVVDRNLDVAFRSFVQLLARLKQCIDLTIYREVEVRHLLLRLGQPPSYRPPYVAERLLPVLEAKEIGELFGTRTCGRRRGRGRCGFRRQRRCRSLASSQSGLDICLHNPPVGATALQLSKIQSGLLRHAARQWTGKDAVTTRSGCRRGRGSL